MSSAKNSYTVILVLSEGKYNFDFISVLRRSIFSTMTYFRFSDGELRKITNLKFITTRPVSLYGLLARENLINLVQLILSRYNMPSFNSTLSINWRLCICQF